MRPLRLATAKGATIVLRRATILGAGPDAELRASGPGVAARHARFSWTKEEGWKVEAAGGEIRRNGLRIERASIVAGDLLAFGSIALRVQEQGRRWSRLRIALVVAAAFVLALLGAGLARASDPAAADAGLHLEADGPSSHWEGERSSIPLLLAIYDPTRVLVELELQTPGRSLPVVLEVNGERFMAVEAADRQIIPLRAPLLSGTNRILLRDEQGQPIRTLEARVITTPLPACAIPSCLELMEEALARAERLARERRVAPANLFESWRWMRKARGYAIAAGNAEAEARVERKTSEIETALDDRCGALRFAAARFLAHGETDAARAVGNDLLRAFPGAEHPCNAMGQELLRLLAEGRSR